MFEGDVYCSRECVARSVGMTARLRKRAARVEALRALLAERYPGGSVPYGTWPPLALEFKASPEWISKTARELGWKIQPGLKAKLREPQGSVDVHG